MNPSALIVPLRDFDTAKTRLSGCLSHDQRSALARLCARLVLDRAADCHRFVVCDSVGVATWARDIGIETVQVSSPGLNAALAEALPIVCLRHPGSDVVIAHGDIVEPSGLDDLLISPDVAGTAAVTIVPDRLDDGTNVLRLGSQVVREWQFQYGPRSFTRHVAQADFHGWSTIVHRDDGLATDVDTPDDLNVPLVRAFLQRHFPEWNLNEFRDPDVRPSAKEIP